MPMIGELGVPLAQCITDPCFSSAVESTANRPVVDGGYLPGRVDKVLWSDWLNDLFGLPPFIGEKPEETAPKPSDTTGGSGAESRLAINQQIIGAVIIGTLAFGAFILLRKA